MKEYLDEYKYTGITGLVYTPYIQDGLWYVVPRHPVSFLQLVYLCNIPEDEALIIKLKYSSKVSV